MICLIIFKQGTRELDGFSPNISKVWRQPPTCSFKYYSNNKKHNSLYNHRNRYVTESEIYASTMNEDSSDVMEADDDSNNVIQIAARSKTSRSFDTTLVSDSTSLVVNRFTIFISLVVISLFYNNNNLMNVRR